MLLLGMIASIVIVRFCGVRDKDRFTANKSQYLFVLAKLVVKCLSSAVWPRHGVA